MIILQEELDKKLQERQARETGICPIREELYSQAFDELIRQTTINCAERGFLLVRVRDEIKMTIQAYQTLYESSVAYGMRKALQAEQLPLTHFLPGPHCWLPCPIPRHLHEFGQTPLGTLEEPYKNLIRIL